MSSPSTVRSIANSRLADAQRRSSRMRWAGVLAAVVGAHFIAAQWFERHRDTFKPVSPEHVPVQVALLKQVHHRPRKRSPPRPNVVRSRRASTC